MTTLAIAVGLVIGLSLGTLGGGGSILTVPALVYLLGQSPSRAVTASLFVVGIAAVAGAAVHAGAGRLRIKEGVTFGALGIAGSFVGSRASAAVPANVLLAGFGLLMLAVAGIMAARRFKERHRFTERRLIKERRLREPRRFGKRGLAAGDAEVRFRRAALLAAAATIVGLVTGFFGVGGGFVVVPAMVLVLGFDMAAAAGTSLVVIAINSAAALAARAGSGTFSLNWVLIGVFAAAVATGALAGGRLAGRISPQRLSAAFTVLIVAVAGYTLARSLPALA